MTAQVDANATGLDTAELLRIVEGIAAQARPGEQLEAYVGRSVSTTVKAYQGEVESISSAQNQGIGIRVISDHRQGFAHCGTLDPAVIAETLAEARDNVRFGQADEFLGLAMPDGVEAVEHDTWNDAVVMLPADRKVTLALEMERAVRGLDPRITGVRTATYADSAGEAAVASSNGITATARGTSCSVSVLALANDGGETKTGGGVDVGRDPAVLDLSRTAADAVHRAVRLFGAKAVPSQTVTVFLEPRLAVTLLGLATATLDGETVQKGRSPFADRVGELIASPLLTVFDDATDPASLGATSHDGEGLACRRNAMIENGVLRGFLQNSYTARKDGTVSTGSALRGYRSTPGVGPHVLVLTPGTLAHDDLLATVDNGVYVTSFSGLHSGVNTISGDFSAGVEGLMIRNGAMAEPVREVTLGSTIQKLMLDIRAVGADREWLPGGTGSASIVIDGVRLSGT